MPQYSGMWTLSQVSQAVKNQTWTGLPPSVVEYLIVAGGGTGRIGGGGAGGLLAGYHGITAGSSYTVTVGAGGAGGGTSWSFNTSTSGNNSVFENITASGGGLGGNYAGVSGGSGGGGGAPAGDPTIAGGSGISGQGNAGGSSYTNAGTSGSDGGGGGGAGTIGLNAPAVTGYGGNGGAGIASAITGTVTTYAGGGGGGGYVLAGTGGVGGGGNGAINAGSGTAGATNSGGGGGGAAYPTGTNGSGGSGVVIIRYPGTTQFFTGGTLSYANGYMIHTFYANGTLAPTAPTLYANPDYQIARSLRFNSADSAYLNRTPASATNRKTWTWSAWVKRGLLTNNARLFCAQIDASNRVELMLNNDASDVLRLELLSSASSSDIVSTALFRDPSAWYHIVVAVDTTQATNTDRVKIYVNNLQLTSFTSATYPAQNTEYAVNNNVAHNIGRSIGYSRHFDGYMTELNFIDGQALTPSSFGWTNPATGVWAPLDFVGTYGTNGFYLNFSDNSNTTAGTLGADLSGNGNNWTPNNFSVTAGAGNDSLVDTPTSYGTDTGVGGEVRGNYATLSPLFFNAVTTIVPTNGNLDFTFASAANRSAYGSIGMSTGKWYCEVIYTTLGGSPNPGLSLVTGADTSQYLGFGSAQYSYDYGGTKVNNNSGTAYGASWTTNDVIGIAFDADAGTLTFYKNGVSQGVAFSSIPAGTYVFGVTSYNGGTGNINFGQRAWAYAPPSGFKALCTQNLPTPTIGATAETLANKYFDVSIYTGNGATPSTTPSSQTVLNSGGFQPDFVWIKSRSNSYPNFVWDVIRGVSNDGYLATASTDPQNSDNTGNQLSSFNSNGFSVQNTTGGSVGTNNLASTFVGWQWKAGGTAVTNTSGSITSSVSASPASGFSVVTFTTDGTTKTVGHGLGVAPKLYIVKQRNGAGGPWYVFTTVIDGSLDYLVLNATDAKANSSYTAPTSTVFEYNDDNAATQVAYCFAEVEGYSKFGSYTGNGNADGTFVYTGFRPRYVLLKITNSTGNWFLMDTARNPNNNAGRYLSPNLTDVEYSDINAFDILSNGFKLRLTASTLNGSGNSFVYAAFAENPFKYSLAR